MLVSVKSLWTSAAQPLITLIRCGLVCRSVPPLTLFLHKYYFSIWNILGSRCYIPLSVSEWHSNWTIALPAKFAVLHLHKMLYKHLMLKSTEVQEKYIQNSRERESFLFCIKKALKFLSTVTIIFVTQHFYLCTVVSLHFCTSIWIQMFQYQQYKVLIKGENNSSRTQDHFNNTMEFPSIAQLLLGRLCNSWMKWSNFSLFPKLISKFLHYGFAYTAQSYSLGLSLFGHRTDYEIASP